MHRALAAVVGCAVLAGAASHQAEPPHAARTVVDRFNEGATHSPQLERMLAGRRAQLPGAEAGRPRASRPDASPLPSPTSTPDGASTVEGLDVASGQHPDGVAIDWNEVAGAGFTFAFIKATEGSYYVNPYDQGDTTAAEAAGLMVAPYAFAIPNYSGGAYQADYAVDHSGYARDGRTLPLILDVEPDPYAGSGPGDDGTSGSCYGFTPAQMIGWISAFVTEADRRTGQVPVIYTDQDWWNTCTGDSSAFTADPLWVASYGSSPVLPGAWSGTWAYWQYTSSAKVPGISEPTDTSWLNSSALELAGPADQSEAAGGEPSLGLHSLDGAPAAATYTATGLPPGVTINSATGVISGRLPAKEATFPVSVTASATGAPSVAQSFSWAVHGSVSFGRLRSRSGSVASPVRVQVTASDGLTGCTLRYGASGLPRGLTMNSCGLISGWLQRTGRYRVAVSATDSSRTVLASRTFSWTVSRAPGTGPAGQLRLRRDGRCLEARSGTDIAIGTCSAWSRERWTIVTDGRVRGGGGCLAAAAIKTGNDSLSLTGCGASAQRWQLGADGALTDISTGTCLVDTGVRNAARAYAAACTDASSERWTLPAGPLTSGIPGYCASSRRGVTLRRCTSSAAQAWTIEPDGALGNGGKCLGLVGGRTTRGTKASLVACTSAADQVWQVSGGPVGVQIVSPVAGMCLADPGDRATAGTALALEPCVAGDPGISWRVS